MKYCDFSLKQSFLNKMDYWNVIYMRNRLYITHENRKYKVYCIRLLRNKQYFLHIKNLDEIVNCGVYKKCKK